MVKSSDRQVFIIAEIGQAHDGSLGIMHSLIEASAKLGVNGDQIPSSYC